MSLMKMFMYISQDPRYLNLRGDKRRIIFAWAQREYRNLLRAREGVRVPKPIHCKDNIVITEFIGEGNEAALMLKDCDLDDPKATFDTIIDMMKKLMSEIDQTNTKNQNGLRARLRYMRYK